MKVSEDMVGAAAQAHYQTSINDGSLWDAMRAALEAALSALPPDGEAVAWASCPGCNGTGDQGGNPSYGVCDDCGGAGKIGTVDLPSPGNADRSEGTDWAYLAAVLEVHADKFPVPSHIRTYAAALRSAPPQTEEGDKRVVELERLDQFRNNGKSQKFDAITEMAQGEVLDYIVAQEETLDTVRAWCRVYKVQVDAANKSAVELVERLAGVIRAYDANSGNEPSVSVLARAIDEARAALATRGTP